MTEESPHVYIDFQKLLNHIEGLDQVNPKEKNNELINWLEKLPSMIDRLQDNVMVHHIWIKYISLVEKNMDDYRFLCSQSLSLIKNVFEILEDNLPKLIIIPNYL